MAFEAFWQYSFVRPSAFDCPTVSTSSSGLDVDSEPTAFHKARIRAKRLRYTTEFFATFYGKRAQRLIDVTTALQERVQLERHSTGTTSRSAACSFSAA